MHRRLSSEDTEVHTSTSCQVKEPRFKLVLMKRRKRSWQLSEVLVEGEVLFTEKIVPSEHLQGLAMCSSRRRLPDTESKFSFLLG